MFTPPRSFVNLSILLFSCAFVLGSCSGARHRAVTAPEKGGVNKPSDADSSIVEERVEEAGRSSRTKVMTAARDTLARWLQGPDPAPVSVQEQAARRFYERRGYEPAWFAEDGTLHNGGALLNRLSEAWREGLSPDLYLTDTLARALDALQTGVLPEPAALSRADLLLTRGFLHFGRDLLQGAIEPGRVHEKNHLGPAVAESVALDSLLVLAVEAGSADPFVDAIVPRHAQYDRLREALVRYRALYRNGGWGVLPAGLALERGDRDRVVPLLRERLAVTGDLDSTALADTSTVFDATTVQALARFQRRHGLRVDGVLGPSTRAALNVPVTERIRQIERSLERWRWLPVDPGTRYVLVNLPEYRLYGYDGDRVETRMRVIIGSAHEEMKTPVFNDQIGYVVFRPYWTIPPMILHREILPRALNDSTYLQRNRYEIVDGNRVIGYGPESLEGLQAERLYLRQRPGPGNSLGLVKFMFPNRYNIYIHDTPADHLFSRTRRALSHGCIRVHEPVEFARFVLGEQRDDQGRAWDPDRIRAAMWGGQEEGPERNTVALEQSLPVYLTYLTAMVRDTGTIFFLDDVYGYDAALEAARQQVDPGSGARTVLAHLEPAVEVPESCVACDGPAGR